MDRFGAWLGGYQPDMRIRLGVDASGGPQGTTIDAERDFGLDRRHPIGRARVDFLLGDHQGFGLDAYRYDDRGARTLDRRVIYDGNAYDIDAAIRSRFGMDFVSAAWHWWLDAGEHDVVGVGIGAAYYRLALDVVGEVTVDGPVGGSAAATSHHSEAAWAPVLTLGWRHAFTRDVRVYVDLSGVRKNAGSLQGHIFSGALGVEYFPWEHVGLGVEYAANRIHLDKDGRDYAARLRLRLQGPAAFMRVRF
ncbi:MAG: hypothetical protein ABFC67_13450 [Mizugakiibacter sp.]|uniref:hypothetical protein n=1 Tax=Mizugakiibacter sp. TaxID=1972610 RepID=UPI0031C91715|nr:hypothetical protein [Xanthomonadaceae bacterium]